MIWVAAIILLFAVSYLGTLFVPKPQAVAIAVAALAVFMFGDRIARLLPFPVEAFTGIGMVLAGAMVGMLVRVFGPQGARDRDYWIGVAIIGVPVGLGAFVAGAMATSWVLNG
jgi:hypothetical protein